LKPQEKKVTVVVELKEVLTKLEHSLGAQLEDAGVQVFHGLSD